MYVACQHAVPAPCVRNMLPQVSGLYTASCLVTKAMMKEKPEDEKPKAVVRPYTPVSPPDARGYMDLIVKGENTRDGWSYCPRSTRRMCECLLVGTVQGVYQKGLWGIILQAVFGPGQVWAALVAS